MSELKVCDLNGAPGWRLDGEPFVPVLAQAGRAGLCEARDGKLLLAEERAVRVELTPPPVGDYAVGCTFAAGTLEPGEFGPRVMLDGRTETGAPKRYSLALSPSGPAVWAAHGQTLAPEGAPVIVGPPAAVAAAPRRMRLIRSGHAVGLEVDGLAAGTWNDPDPLSVVDRVWLVASRSPATADDLTIEDSDGKAVFAEGFDDPRAVARRFTGDLAPAGPLPATSFFTAGCKVYTTWENGPQLSLVWKEDGSYDWSEVDGYLRKLAALDPDGRIQLRFGFDAPAWWVRRHPDQMVHVRHLDGRTEVTGIVSFGSPAYWNEAEKAARDLVRFCETHPEGWRVVGVLYSGGFCEWFPQWGEGYSDYSPANRAGFRDWLRARYGTSEALRAAWKEPDASFETAEPPTPEERVRGDWYEFYDPARGLRRQDFFLYGAETVAGLIERLARAFKEASGGRLFTRTTGGYQPGGRGFRYHTGPHATLSDTLRSPWLDGFFMPHDYRGRGMNGFTGFEIPLASVHLHGKTYITEVDDRTHHVEDFLFGATQNSWQTAQALKRTVGAALCQASGVEFKDWAAAWFEDTETMDLIRRLNALAQETARWDRSPAAEIAVLVNPGSTCHVRDDSLLYDTLNNQQMHLCYPRIGAPHDRILVDDLDRARDYKLYIVQDAMFLSDVQRRLVRERVCVAGHTVLWIYAPGVVSERGVGPENVSELVGMRIRARKTYECLHLALRLTAGGHPYNQGVSPGTSLHTWEGLYPLFYVDDSSAVTLGYGGDVHNSRPAFALKAMDGWTSVYCSAPVLPPVVIRNIAREAGAHIYSDRDDFVAANNNLLTLCASNDGPRTVRLPRRATVRDALTGAVVLHDGNAFEVAMRFGETAIWILN